MTRSHRPAADPSRELRFPSIEALRAFDAVARWGSHERAADELAITASAVSKRLATLEDLLGTPLLVRSGRSLTLTVRGREYLAQVREALGLLAAMPLHQRASQQRRRLRVSAPPTFAREVLVPALPGYTEAHPEIELELVLSIPFLQDAAPVEADVEVRLGDVAVLGVEPLMHDRLVPMAAPALLARCGLPATPAALDRQRLLRTPIEPWTPWLRAAGLDWPEPDAGARLVDLGLTLQAAVQGQGFVLARPSLARAALAAGALRPLFADRVVPAQTLYHLHLRSPGEAEQAFAAWLQRAAAQAAQAGLEALSAQP